MRYFHGYAEVNEAFSRPIFTIGNFDGLHLGHRKIIESVIERAAMERGTSVVYTFRPHPHLALVPSEDLQLINTYDEKVDILKHLGIDVLIEENFSREFSELTPERFVRDILIKQLSARAIYVGYDFGFGRNRGGNLELLKQLGEQEGVEVHVAKPLKIDGEICSSTRIRQYVSDGNVVAANRLLGREFFYRGLIFRGNGRGHKIGFATANLHGDSKLCIKEGVYASWAMWRGQAFPSVTNVGRQPTFNAGVEVPVTIETHILDFDRDIYGDAFEVRFVERLRGEKRFSGAQALVSQIHQDCAAARRVLKITK